MTWCWDEGASLGLFCWPQCMYIDLVMYDIVQAFSGGLPGLRGLTDWIRAVP